MKLRKCLISLSWIYSKNKTFLPPLRQVCCKCKHSIITYSLTELFNPDQIITFPGSKEVMWCCFGAS